MFRFEEAWTAVAKRMNDCGCRKFQLGEDGYAEIRSTLLFDFGAVGCVALQSNADWVPRKACRVDSCSSIFLFTSSSF